MTNRFDWKDEEDPSLTLDPSQSGKGQLTGSKRQRVLLGIALVLFFTVGIISFRALQQYLEQTNSRVQVDLLAQNDLVLTAAKNADRDILASLISDRDPVWTEGQLDLVESGLMFDRRTFGLNMVEEPPKVERLTISPELDSATVVVRFSYERESANPQERTIGLLQELNYRSSNGRWLLSAPVSGYWEGSVLDEGHYVSIRYPGRDNRYGERLAVDLEALTAEFCARYPTHFCINELPVKIVLGANPKSITETELQISLPQSNNHIELPTPTVFGVPEDEEGYTAMYRAFGRHLVERIVKFESGWSCCGNRLLFQSLLDHQLVQLALKSSNPLAGYNRLDLDESLLELGERIWSVNQLADKRELRDEKMAADILVDYLVKNMIRDERFRLQQYLVDADSFHEWLQMSFGPTEVEYLKEAWHTYLKTQTGSGEN